MNPIIQMLNKPNMLTVVSNLANIARGNPQGMFEQMMRTNPQFKAFVDSNRGKSVEQIANDYGVDIGLVKQFMR